jgi:hypothetical protein
LRHFDLSTISMGVVIGVTVVAMVRFVLLLTTASWALLVSAEMKVTVTVTVIVMDPLFIDHHLAYSLFSRGSRALAVAFSGDPTKASTVQEQK